MMRFICDEMLISLGKWLRIAGYDTVILEPKTEDKAILERAIQENRLLLTRDRHFLRMKDANEQIVFLSSNSLDDCVEELNNLIKIDWLYDPFSRCTQCNTLLIETDDKTYYDQIPPDVVELSSKIWICPLCHKIYWKGTHTEKMLFQLAEWQKSNNFPEKPTNYS